MSRVAWPTRSIGNLFHIGAGKTMSAKAREGLQRTQFLRTSNVFWDEIDLSTVDEMAISDEELREKSLQKGDLLVCEGGDIGRAAVWMGERDVMSFQNHLHRLRPKTNLTNSRFYVYFLQCGFTQLGIYEGAGNKTTIPNLSRNRLAALEVPLPSLSEQQAITNLLAMVRKGLNVHIKAEKIAHELKAACMQQLFTCGLHGEEQKETEIGPMPQSWNPKSILELCDIWSGGTPRKSIAEYWSGDIPWVSGKDLKRPALEDVVDHISQAGVDAGSRVAPKGSVLLLVRGMGLAKDLPVAVIKRPMAFNQDVKALVTRGQYSGEFLRAAIYGGKDRLLSQIVPSAHGTMTLNLNDVESFKIACPPDNAEATEVVTILDALEQKIALHQQKKSVLNEIFRSLLHKLMTGEISVDDLDLSVLSNEEPQRQTEAEVQS